MAECVTVWGAGWQVTESKPTVVRISGSTFSLRVLAAAIILLFFYYAAGVVITLLLSMLLAYFLDPAVEFLERLRVPRTLGALLMVLLLISVIVAVGFELWAGTGDFAANWPRYSGVLRQAAGAFDAKIQGIAGQVSQIAPQGEGAKPSAVTLDPALIHTLILRGVGSMYALVLEITFLPFLVFFMLAEKQQAWHGTLQLFPAAQRTAVKETLEDLRDVLRGYLVGMSLVTLMMMAASSLFFWALGIDYPILTGIVSGLLNMVPYLGAVLAWLPPFMLALAKWRTVGHFVVIAGVLTTLHVLAQNFLAPQLVGRRVRLNAVAITVALLFWGWVWGGMGLILAIPITAALRVVCDHTESWKGIGRWLSA